MTSIFKRVRSSAGKRAEGERGASLAFWTLGRKVFAAHLVHVLLLITLLGCGAYRVVLGYIREKQPDNLKTVARMVAGLVDKDVRGAGLLLEKMIHGDAVVKYKTSYNLLALEKHLTRYADRFQRISYFDEHGVEVFRLLDGHPEDSLSIEPDKRFIPGRGIEPNRVHVFTPAMDSGPYVSIMELAYRHIDFFDESLGSIVAGVSCDHLSDAIFDAVAPQNAIIAVIDGDGRLVFSPETLRYPELPRELESLRRRSGSGFGRYRLFGKDCFVAREKLPDLNWTVLVAQPEQVYYADLRKLTGNVLLVLVATACGAQLLALYFSRGFVRPVLMLNDKISRVSRSGDMAQRVHWTSRDEFGLLVDSYNKMLVRLHEADNQMAMSREKISHLVFHDTLTDLPNRTMLLQSLESAMDRAKREGGRVAVLIIDLDDFKLVNDTMGHGGGDRLLCAVAGRLRDAVRKNDFICRPGGDEFIVFMEDYSAAGDPFRGNDFYPRVSELAGRIIQKIKEPFPVEDYEVYVSPSVGISIFPGDADDARTLLQHACSALSSAKGVGGGQVRYYSPEFSRLQKYRMTLATGLHKAVERKEFVLLYQPVIDLEDGRIVGAEALLRWQSGEETLLPDAFITLSEETGLILPIGEWVIHEACRRIREWTTEGLGILFLSINLSARQFWHSDITTRLLKTVEEHNVLPKTLELEVTESAVMKDPQRMQEMLTALHAKGFNLALDDFGTGYSSLLRLQRLPIGKLKIDKSFLEGCPFNEEHESLVTAIVQLSGNLGIHAQAEGIETSEQWRFLRDLGCRYGQGYFFSPPVSATELAEMIRCDQRWDIPPGCPGDNRGAYSHPPPTSC